VAHQFLSTHKRNKHDAIITSITYSIQAACLRYSQWSLPLQTYPPGKDILLAVQSATVLDFLPSSWAEQLSY